MKRPLRERLREVRKLFAEGALEEAERKAEKLLQEYGDIPEVWLLMGSIREARGNLDEAIFALEEALHRAEKTLRDVLRNYAYFLSIAGRWEEAERAYERLFQLGLGEPGVFFYLGRVRMRLGKREEAKEAFQKAIDLDASYGQDVAAEFPEIAVEMGLPEAEEVRKWLELKEELQEGSEGAEES